MKASVVINGVSIHFDVQIEKRSDNSNGPPLEMEIQGIRVTLAGVADGHAFYTVKK